MAISGGIDELAGLTEHSQRTVGAMGRLRVMHRSTTQPRVHGPNPQTRDSASLAGTTGATWKNDSLETDEPLGRAELAESGTGLRRMLEAVRPAAPADVIARLEGAIIVLDALAAGKPPSADDLLVPGPYTI
jgi:hypothetical protein